MIAVVCHDAGGAEILSSWLRQNIQNYCLVIEGPAIGIFKRKLGHIEIFTLDDAINLCDWMLCGTSWQSNLEKRAIALAKYTGKKVVAYLDHWINYAERFQLNKVSVYPDEIWVVDVYAKILAQKEFPNINVILTPNPYFIDLQIELSTFPEALSGTRKCTALYICEPIREHALLAYGHERYWGYTEEEALQFFLENIDVIDNSICEIKIRPHPSESKEKYEWAKLASPLVTETASDKTLLQQIVEAEIVVGCGSMALVVALLANKRVISSIPPDGKACALPHLGVEHLRVLITKN